MSRPRLLPKPLLNLGIALFIWHDKLAARLDRSRLDGGGERVDILHTSRGIDESTCDMYQLSHLRRYAFARSAIVHGGATADLACGTGYGAVLLAQVSSRVLAIDLDQRAISAARQRYRDVPNVTFDVGNLLELQFASTFDNLVSFETVEHFEQRDIPRLLDIYWRSLKPGGRFVFSTPLEQVASAEAVALGFHKTYNIDEQRVASWLSDAHFNLNKIYYQSYADHKIDETREGSDFIICVASKCVCD